MHRVLALLGLFAIVQGFRVPPPAAHHNLNHHQVVVDHRPPPMLARPHADRVQLDQGDREYISHEISDPDVGTSGITALKDPELGACFMYRYMKPLIIPRVQRHFYTRTKTATILLTEHDKRKFRQSVGPAIDKLCNTVRSYWLDENMFYLYMTNRLHPKNAPPPAPADPEDDDMSAALVYPTPPPLPHPEETPDHEDHAMKMPPGLAHHEVKTPPGLAHHEIRAPPGAAHHEVRAPPGLAHHGAVHRVRVPPGVSDDEPMKIPPPPDHHEMKVPPPLP